MREAVGFESALDRSTAAGATLGFVSLVTSVKPTLAAEHRLPKPISSQVSATINYLTRLNLPRGELAVDSVQGPADQFSDQPDTVTVA